MRKVLITGIAGFIGHHFMDHFLVNTDWKIIGIESFKHKGIAERITDSEHYQKDPGRVEIFTHDLSVPISSILGSRIGRVDYIINLASESHVERSIINPVPFVKNNIDLVLNILEYARQYPPEKYIQISTDEVYGPVRDEAHKEWDSMIPSNPYSASKGSQELIAISYWRTYGLPIIITNTMNVIGERQASEKFLPICIKKILYREMIDIHSQDGEIGTRFYLHARNFADAILFILNNFPARLFPDYDRPERINIVGKTELSNLDLAEKIAEIMKIPLSYQLIDVNSSRPGYDLRYGMDGYRLEDAGYNFPVPFDESLEKTVNWHLKRENQEWLSS